MADPWKRRVEIGPHVLFEGDCLEILPTLGKVDAVVTDPPYGVSGQQNTRTAQRRGHAKNAYASITDSPDYVRSIAVPAIEICIKIARSVVVTPGNRCLGFYPNATAFGAIYQPASVGLQPWGRADAQPILYYGKSPHGGRALPGQRCSFSVTNADEPNGHPCPKPLALIKSLVCSASLVHEQVADPFMGSGTAGVACVQEGRRFIGIELDPGYFDIACARIEAEMRQPRLDLTPAPKPEQVGMDL